MIKTIPYHSALKFFITNLESIEQFELEKIGLVLPWFAAVLPNLQFSREFGLVFL